MSHYNKPIFLRKIIEFVIWPLQAIVIAPFVLVMHLLPVALLSSLFGALLSVIGPFTTHHKRAMRHLSYAMPEKTDAEKTEIVTKMWRHFGHLIGEYPHIHHMGSDRFMTFHGLDHLEEMKQGGFIIGAHLGNWELHMMTSVIRNEAYGLVYRPLNNPLTNWLLDMRQKRGDADLYAKGKDAARGMMKTIKKGGIVYLFTDQKYRQGVVVPFMGQDADTAIGHIKIALKQPVPITYMRAIRRDYCHYDIYIEKPFTIYTDGQVSDAAIAKHAKEMNDKLSDYIRQTPEQWLWPHRRWGKDI